MESDRLAADDFLIRVFPVHTVTLERDSFSRLPRLPSLSRWALVKFTARCVGPSVFHHAAAQVALPCFRFLPCEIFVPTASAFDQAIYRHQTIRRGLLRRRFWCEWRRGLNHDADEASAMRTSSNSFWAIGHLSSPVPADSLRSLRAGSRPRESAAASLPSRLRSCPHTLALSPSGANLRLEPSECKPMGL